MQKKKPRTSSGSDTASPPLDELDRKILAAVQVDNQQPLRKIARSVNLSTPAVARRLQRLRARKVIDSDVSALNAAAVGRPLTVIVEVSVESEILAQLDAVRRRFIACPAVQQCYYVTGDVDFVLILTLRDMSEYEELTRSLFFSGGNVRQFRTLVVMQRAKVGTAVPLS
jgi:Lrp/AsnC family transcriptional regulator, leucine-responsive regulatory protein